MSYYFHANRNPLTIALGRDFGDAECTESWRRHVHESVLRFVAAEPKAVGPQTMSKIRRNPERTRRRILDAAIEEFASKTLDGARVDAIAARAGVNKRMLYHYFGNKEALFTAAMDSEFARARPQVMSPCPPAEDPQTALRELIESMFAYFERDPRTTILVNSSNLHGSRHLHGSPAFRSILEERVARMTAILDHGCRTGAFRDGLNPTLPDPDRDGDDRLFLRQQRHTVGVRRRRPAARRPAHGVARPCDRLLAPNRQTSCRRNGCAG